MTVPPFDQFIEPLLRYLGAQTAPVSAGDAHEAVADVLGLSEAQRRQTISTGQPTYKNRCGWAHDRLKRAELSQSRRRGYWELTERGRQFLNEHPGPLSEDEIKELATQNTKVRLGAVNGSQSDGVTESREVDDERALSVSPHERLEIVLKELRRKVADELLEALHVTSPTFFEIVVLDVLHRMGYGTSREDLERVGGSGDGGIDGVISLDKLGLEKVYVQAKRWRDQTISRQDIQAFYGALAGRKAKKGVFITTSTYSRHAVDYANAIEGIVLIDGVQLVNLMMDYEVGVSSRTLKLPQLDSDYFDEDSI